jgi:DNA-binding NarL/FixJ family response regulator
MNGFQTLEVLRKEYPGIRVIGLSMDDHENTILKMIGMGARGYVLKDSEPHELKSVLDAVWNKGYSYTDFITTSLINSLQNKELRSEMDQQAISLNSREVEFLKWVCKELTYKEIADKMCLSTRTIDGYRDNLFQRLGVKNRVGLALYAVRSGIYKL